MWLKLVLAICLVVIAAGQKDPHAWPGRSAIVHLFEWKFSDVADECERFLAPKGFAAVQLSPVRENLVIPNRPWWERYQPVSYKIITRSGDEAAFKDMTRRCNDVGIRIFVDVTPNHMSTADVIPAFGTGGSTCDPVNKNYPAVPYTAENFHDSCQLNDWSNLFTVRHCELNGLRDLIQGSDYVRGKLIEYFNHLIELGAGGFRVDAAALMCPKDIYYIFSQLNDLNTDYGFAPGSRAFVYQEVVDYGKGVVDSGAIFKYDYNSYARVTEFQFGMDLSTAFRGNNPIKYLQTYGPEWGLMPSDDGVVFIDNHDTQRQEPNILTYKESKMWKMAVSFMLAWTHGYPRIISSYYFDNADIGPPQDSNENIISPSINPDDTCGNGWVCEHRWSQIYGMVGFRNAVDGTEVAQWWDNGNKQIAFCRGGKGFIAFNDDDGDLQQNLQTCLPPGKYCDIASGRLLNGACTGKVVEVGADGVAYIEILNQEDDGFLAIHIDESPQKSGVSDDESYRLHPKLAVTAKLTKGVPPKSAKKSPMEKDDPVFPDCP